MILGIGVDIVEISRFEQENAREVFIKKVFTPKEIEECQLGKNTAVRFAEKFAIKEAFMKAIGAGIRQEVWFTNIEVLNKGDGNPEIKTNKKARQFFEALNVYNILISFSSSKKIVIGFVMLTA